MSHPRAFVASQALRRLEAARGGSVLVLAALALDLDLLPALYHTCTALGSPDRLEVVLLTRGGSIHAARRIALLLRRSAARVTVHVPHHCESAGTLLALAADEIVAGELAIFTPIDPHLSGSAAGDDSDRVALSCRDIEQFGAMARDWFQVDAAQAGSQLLALLCGSVQPPALTAFYRAVQDVERIGRELLRYQLPDEPTRDEGEARRRGIVQQLIHGYGSHDYALNATDLMELGLAVRCDPHSEALAWEIGNALQPLLGAGQRQAPEDPWCDAVLATRTGVRWRERRGDGLAPRWSTAGLAP